MPIGNEIATPVGNEFLVNTSTLYSQVYPNVLGLPDGKFVITWVTLNGMQIKGRIFDPNTGTHGAEFQISSDFQNAEHHISTVFGGRFAVTWRNWDGPQGSGNYSIRAQVFFDSGDPDGSEFLVSPATIDYKGRPVIIPLGEGNFRISWQVSSDGSPSGALSVVYQDFEAGGISVGPVRTYPGISGTGILKNTVLLTDGSLIAVWQADTNGGDGSTGFEIFGQRFKSDGSADGGFFQISNSESANQVHPIVAALEGGGFIVVWQDHSQTVGVSSGSAVRAQIFSSDGVKLGSNFLVNTTIADDQSQPFVTSLSDGRIVIAWTDDSMTGGDTSDAAIRAQIFEIDGLAAPSLQLLEFLARDTAYRISPEDPDIDELFLGATVGVPDFPKFDPSHNLWGDVGYRVDKTFVGPLGFVAVGLVGDNLEPVLAIRGSASPIDWLLANTDPRGIGVNQFQEAWASPTLGLENWLRSHEADGLHIVGHSLGGAQAQLVAAHATEVGISLSSVTTYNAPGVSDWVLEKFNPQLVEQVTHNISSGDIVSMAGQGFLPGSVNVYDHDTFNPLHLKSVINHIGGAHTDHWSNAGLYSSIYSTAVSDTSPPTYIAEITSEDLNRDDYSHLYSNGFIDTEYFGALLKVALVGDAVSHIAGLPKLGSALSKALMTREDTEELRVKGGALLHAFDQFGLDLEQASPEVYDAMVAVGGWTIDKVKTVASWSVDTWSNVVHMGKDWWDATVNWSTDKILAIADWAGDRWNEAQKWTMDTWEAFMGLSLDVIRDVSDVGASALREVTRLGSAISDSDILPFVTNPVWTAGKVVADVIIGGAEREHFSLGTGDDELNPGGGFDLIRLGAGADVIKGAIGDLDGDHIFDFTDQDRLELSGILLDLIDFDFFKGSAILDIDTNGDGVSDTTITLEGDVEISDIVVFHAGGNTIITTRGSNNGINQNGTDGADSIVGSSGNDTVRGLGGSDTLNGASGDDVLNGGAGDDSILAGDGDNLVLAGDGNDYLSAFGGHDKIYGGFGNDTLYAGAGNDSVGGAGGADQIGGGADNDELWGGWGNDTIYGGTGNDTIGAGSEHDEVGGGGGNDTIWAGSGNDTVYGNDNDDEISGGLGADMIYAGTGNDTIFAGAGNDTLGGVGGNDEIWAGAGDDVAYGWTGNDTLLGLAGNDDLWGGNGSDTLNGGTGDDTLRGGADADTLVFSLGADRAIGFGPGDVVDLSAVASITDFADLQSAHLSGATDAVIFDGLSNTMTLIGVGSGTLDAGDFIF